MHAVKVGVGVNGMGVIVFVGIGVAPGVLAVEVIRFCGETMTVSSAVSFISGDSDGWIAVDEGGTRIEFTGTCPQACKRTTRTQRTVNLLRTLAVYHNKPIGNSKLSSC